MSRRNCCCECMIFCENFAREEAGALPTARWSDTGGTISVVCNWFGCKCQVTTYGWAVANTTDADPATLPAMGIVLGWKSVPATYTVSIWFGYDHDTGRGHRMEFVQSALSLVVTLYDPGGNVLGSADSALVYGLGTCYFCLWRDSGSSTLVASCGEVPIGEINPNTFEGKQVKMEITVTGSQYIGSFLIHKADDAIGKCPIDPNIPYTCTACTKACSNCYNDRISQYLIVNPSQIENRDPIECYYCDCLNAPMYFEQPTPSAPWNRGCAWYLYDTALCIYLGGPATPPWVTWVELEGGSYYLRSAIIAGQTVQGAYIYAGYWEADLGSSKPDCSAFSAVPLAPVSEKITTTPASIIPCDFTSSSLTVTSATSKPTIVIPCLCESECEDQLGDELHAMLTDIAGNPQEATCHWSGLEGEEFVLQKTQAIYYSGLKGYLCSTRCTFVYSDPPYVDWLVVVQAYQGTTSITWQDREYAFCQLIGSGSVNGCAPLDYEADFTSPIWPYPSAHIHIWE